MKNLRSVLLHPFTRLPEGQSPPRPILWVACAHLSGVAMGWALPLPGLLLLALIIVCLAWAAAGWWRSRRIHGPLLGEGLGLLFALLCLGWWQGGRLSHHEQAAEGQAAAWSDGELVEARGVTSGEPQGLGDSVLVVLDRVRVASMRAGGPVEPFKGKVAVYLTGEAAKAMASGGGGAMPLAGQPVRAWGRLHPIMGQTAPGPFDPRLYWRSQGVTARLTVAGPADVELGERPAGPWASMLAGLRAARQGIGGYLDRKLGAREGGLARALLLGEQREVSPEDRENFRVSSLLHLLSVSGLNTGFILVFLMTIAHAIGMRPRSLVPLGLICLAGYCALTEFNPPVVRASIMSGFLLIGFGLGRVSTAPASLALACFMTLLADPRNLLRLDWQLSYACAASIILMTPPIYRCLTFRDIGGWDDNRLGGVLGGVGRFLRRGTILPLSGVAAVQLGLVPIQLAYFHQMTLYALPANVLGVGLSFYGFVGMLLTLALGWIWGVGTAIAWLTKTILASLFSWTAFISGLPGANWPMEPMALWIVVVYYGVLLTGSWLRSWAADLPYETERRQNLWAAARLATACVIVLLAPLLVSPSVPAADGKASLDLYVVDVGQGDCLALRFPNGRTMMVDAGGNSARRGELTIGPFLESLGIHKIDCLVATHADADHICGMPYLIDHFDIGVALEGPDRSGAAIYQQMHDALARRGVPLEHVGADQSLKGFDPAAVRVLGPVENLDGNNASVVLLVSYGDADFLLTGDMESPGENALLDRKLIPDVEILKVAHHGSRTGTGEAFLAVARPEVALVSAGRNNRFKHPSPPTLERLERAGAQTLRTDLLGTLWVRTDGQTITVYRYAGP